MKIIKNLVVPVIALSLITPPSFGVTPQWQPLSQQNIEIMNEQCQLMNSTESNARTAAKILGGASMASALGIVGIAALSSMGPTPTSGAAKRGVEAGVGSLIMIALIPGTAGLLTYGSADQGFIDDQKRALLVDFVNEMEDGRLGFANEQIRGIVVEATRKSGENPDKVYEELVSLINARARNNILCKVSPQDLLNVTDGQ